MYVNTLINAASGQVSTLPISVLKVNGYFRGSTADRWLQIFDSCVAPVNPAVPMYEYPISQTSPFYCEFKNGELHLTEGLFVGVSTTEGTWTTSTDTMDVTVETDFKPVTTTIVGDKTTTVQTVAVWSQAAGSAALAAGTPKMLYGLIVKNLVAAVAYLVMYCDDAGTGTKVMTAVIPASTTVKLYFGDILSGGFRPSSISLVDYATLYYGCSVFVNSAMPANPVSVGSGGTGLGGANTGSNVQILAITN